MTSPSSTITCSDPNRGYCPVSVKPNEAYAIDPIIKIIAELGSDIISQRAKVPNSRITGKPDIEHVIEALPTHSWASIRDGKVQRVRWSVTVNRQLPKVNRRTLSIGDVLTGLANIIDACLALVGTGKKDDHAALEISQTDCLLWRVLMHGSLFSIRG